MDDIESSILAAWNRIGPSLHRNRDELRKRIARFRAASHPPRAWCLAIRASDTRLPVSILPDSLRQNPDGTFPHFPLTLTREDLRRLCVPIQLGEGKRSVCDVAAKLGVTRGGLLPARVKNLFDTEYLRGRHGKPRPLLHTSLPLDPATRGFVAADPVWSWTARRLPARLPPDFPDQTLLRIPHFVTRNPIHPHLNDLHPEHPLLDPPPRKRRSLALPPPPPDFVWYKWKDGQYVGHDWRNPFAVAGHQRHQRQLELARAARKKRAPTRATTPKDSLVFRGWRWICPRCQKPVNVLFLPVPPINLLKGQLLGVSGQLSVVSGQLPVVNGQLSVVSGQLPGEQTGKSASPLPPVSTSPLPPVPSSPLPLVSSSPLLPISSSPLLSSPVSSSPLPSFACERCHRVRRFSRCDPNMWNEIICYLTQGLLYGSEVPRPEWMAHVTRSNRNSQIKNRKLPYTPRPNRAPSQRRPQVEKMLLDGKSFDEIAKELNLAKGTILWTAQQVYKQHNVRTLNEFLAKHGKSPILKKREEVRQRILRGETVAQIARELKISAICVYNHVYMLRKSGAIPKSKYYERGPKEKPRVKEETRCCAPALTPSN